MIFTWIGSGLVFLALAHLSVEDRGPTCDFASWVSWHPCRRACGGGQRRRERGVYCPISDFYECLKFCNITVDECLQYEDCNQNGCRNGGRYESGCVCTSGFFGYCCQHPETDRIVSPNCGWISWTEWETCASTDGKVSRLREPECKLDEERTDCVKRCNVSDRMGTSWEEQDCTVCMWNRWNPWGSCAGDTGSTSGQQIRHREPRCATNETADDCNSRCGNQTSDTKQCLACTWGSWSSWGNCESNDGSNNGTQNRDLYPQCLPSETAGECTVRCGYLDYMWEEIECEALKGSVGGVRTSWITVTAAYVLCKLSDTVHM